MSKAIIYTDGAYFSSTNKAGWCALIDVDSREVVLNGSLRCNNSYICELTPVLEGLKFVQSGYQVDIKSDHKGVVERINMIASGLRDNKSIARLVPDNLPQHDLWVQIAEAMQGKDVHAQWVSRCTDKWTNRVHTGARQAANGKGA